MEFRENKSIKILEFEKTALESKVLVLKDALKCSNKEISSLNLTLKSKNEVVIWNMCSILLFMLSDVVFKLLAMI